jgi:hypothetical protein
VKCLGAKGLALAFGLIVASCFPRAGVAASGDVEIDPLAYVVDGHSLHVGLRLTHQRFDLGNFAAAAPAVFHGNPGFAVYFSGLGAKWDLCWRHDCNGPFAGLDISLARNWITREETGETVDRRQVTAGIRAGYRFAFREDGKGFFVVPWASVGYAWFSRSVTLGGKSFNDRRVAVFPTVHVGYAF